jgi:hypothetical protein
MAAIEREQAHIDRRAPTALFPRETKQRWWRGVREYRRRMRRVA